MKKIFLLLLVLLSHSVYAENDITLNGDSDPVITEEQYFVQFTQSVEMLYEMQPNYKGLSNQTLISALLVSPPRLNKKTITHQFGGTINVAGVTWLAPEKYKRSYIPGEYNAFQITYTHLPMNACKAFINGTIKYFNEIQINSTTFFYTDRADKDDIAHFTGNCQEDNTINFIKAKY